MSKTFHVPGLLAALLLASGCVFQNDGSPTESNPPTVEEAAPSAPSASASSLCDAYERRLSEHRTALASSPKDVTLQEKVATFEALIADACN